MYLHGSEAPDWGGIVLECDEQHPLKSPETLSKRGRRRHDNDG